LKLYDIHVCFSAFYISIYLKLDLEALTEKLDSPMLLNTVYIIFQKYNCMSVHDSQGVHYETDTCSIRSSWCHI